MWAQENNVTLLSAGGNSYNTGTGGSGIFLGEKGALVQMIIPSSGNAKMLLQKVPRSPSSDGVIVNNIDPDEVIDSLAAEMDDFKLNIDPTVYEHTSVPLNLNKTTVIEEICHGESACCKFTINFTVNSELMNLGKNTYTYHIAVFNGVRKFPGVRDVGVESCGIIACLNYSSTSCGQRFPKYSNVTWPITFNSIKVVGSFTNVVHKIQYPSSVLSSLRAISPLKTSWKKEVKVNMVERTHALVKPQSRILTFGIFGRDFSKDDAPHSYSSADLARFAGILLAIAMASFVKTF
ncbi:unnamed protein product [Acanthoscelides obtectus]|nr:unnamed protein product [Acanthoscelides obtectus]CAK1633805.1 Vanin-like protein 3 [Acanthoscelides obtectus]